ncbi:hypothetical protein HYFRA_00008352 [Hymenoscyphus fraxineus]|uniref:Heterokaryon incompatibility domain-containing protein n=1 Tax=Hymenoscyphus fraxineus TaxID=746836 RepID=A0A9N9KQC8_9HELO|nr:hypothetical protein HYFRA_00008352 [Hymenoscyphus fraxineus]
MQPCCRICLDLNPFIEENERWTIGVRDGCVEYVMGFVVDQLEISAGNGCPTCSAIWSGLKLLTSSHSIFPAIASTPQRGRFILQEECPLEIELMQGANGDSEIYPPVRIQYYTAAGDPKQPAFGGAREVPPELSLPRCSSIIFEWIEDCEKNHEACVATTSETLTGESALPRRLIDAGRERALNVSLVDSHDVNVAEHLKYATLSHCWGRSHIIQTTKETLEERKKCIRWSSLPRTFQDAISIVRSLNIQFIWIDSLCIIQDDAEDWKNESVRMATIYSNGYINLAATSASDSRGGCLSSRSIKRISGNLNVEPVRVNPSTIPAIFARLSFDSVHHRYRAGKIQKSDLPDALSVPLLSRAWAFQERHLAPRTVHFHPTEMIMECKTSLICECTGLSKLVTQYKRHSVDKTVENNNKTFNSWLTVVEEYSRLKLTRESDRLPALIGVATDFQRQLKSDYLAGIWSGDFARGLLWDVTRPTERLQQGNPKRHHRLQIPRWSWASLSLDTEGVGIYFPAYYNETFTVDEHLAYISTNLPVVAANIIPADLDAAIWVKGLVVTAIGFPSTQDPAIAKDITILFDQDLDEEVLITVTEMNLDATCGWTGLLDISDCASTVMCLLIGGIIEGDWDSEDEKATYSCSLVLEVEGHEAANMEEQSYKRIGVLDIRDGDALFRDAPELTLKLT